MLGKVTSILVELSVKVIKLTGLKKYIQPAAISTVPAPFPGNAVILAQLNSQVSSSSVPSAIMCPKQRYPFPWPFLPVLHPSSKQAAGSLAASRKRMNLGSLWCNRNVNSYVTLQKEK